MRPVSIVALITAVVVSAIVGFAGFVEVNLDRLTAGDIGTVLLTAIFAALVIERAVEVYINNAFDPEEQRLSRDITIAQRNVEIAEEGLTIEIERQKRTPDPMTLTQARADVDNARVDLLTAKKAAVDVLAQHRAKKASWAGAIATLLSLAAAAVGVRILGQFLPMENGEIAGPLGQSCEAVARAAGDAVSDLSDAQLLACGRVETQLAWFRTADILLTTFVLAGGADGIHQIVKRFTNPGGPASDRG